jgi:hypothetical protein
MIGVVDLLISPAKIPSIFLTKTRINVASDGGQDPSSGISSFGWVIAADKTLIAKGHGPAEAKRIHHSQSHSDQKTFLELVVILGKGPPVLNLRRKTRKN